MSRRRRSRYTVTLVTPGSQASERKVILAYTNASAWAYFSQRGYRVLAVENGDYRIKQREAQVKANASSWRLDRAALREAVARLGIELPVQVKQTGRVGGQRGAHRLRPVRGQFKRNPAFDTAAGGLYHHITVKSYLTPEEAGRTLWHELCHAMQAEQAIAKLPVSGTLRQRHEAWITCEQRGAGISYLRKPIEVEARSYEKFNDEMPLAR